jgi:chromosome segregation ATPase
MPAPGIGFNTSGMNKTNQSQFSSANTANLKGKLTALEEMILQLADELQYHKKEV